MGLNPSFGPLKGSHQLDGSRIGKISHASGKPRAPAPTRRPVRTIDRLFLLSTALSSRAIAALKPQDLAWPIHLRLLASLWVAFRTRKPLEDYFNCEQTAKCLVSIMRQGSLQLVLLLLAIRPQPNLKAKWTSSRWCCRGEPEDAREKNKISVVANWSSGQS